MSYAERTKVSVDRSISEIRRTVERYGAKSFLFAATDGEGVVGFEIHNRVVRIRVPLPALREFRLTPTGRKRDEVTVRVEADKAARQRWRALALVVKALLEAVESGILTIDKAFLAHILIDRTRTVADVLQSKLAAAYLGEGAPKLLGPAEVDDAEG